MATPKQIAANRANAKKSRGPITAAGKEKVSQNRTTHGLLGRFRVMDGENQAEYDAFLDQFVREEKPVDLHETELVKKMAQQPLREVMTEVGVRQGAQVWIHRFQNMTSDRRRRETPLVPSITDVG